MTTFIFDLDGTLLPMPNQELFLDAYYKALTIKMAPYGFDPQKLLKAVFIGVYAMLDNDGTSTNDIKFWKAFEGELGPEIRKLEPVFDDFYRNEFSAARQATFTHPLAKECIKLLKEKGYQIILATNPLFPPVATYNRINWAGLEPEDFVLITTYDNSSYCKPNLNYYREILDKLNLDPKDCIMVGNDVKEDMCAAALGMDTFLLKECLICEEGVDISHLKQGGFEELLEFIRQLPIAKEAVS